MKNFARLVLTLAVAAILVAPLAAQEGKKKKKKGKKKAQQTAPAFRIPNTIQLDEGQEKKLAELRKQYTPKLQSLNEERQQIVSREKMQEANRARREARQAGKNRREVNDAFVNALGLSDDQKTKWEGLQKKQQELNQEVRGKIAEFLTAEQKESFNIGKKKAKKKGKKKGKKKKNADD
jgi:Spy/CpxP family protein refolding chaperone